MKRKWIGIAVVVAVLCVPLLLKLTRSENLLLVESEKITTHEIKASILASGHLVYQEQVQLSPEVLGKVSAIFVKEGQQVKEGEIVLHLDDQSYRAEVAAQQAAVRQQQINIEQQQLNVMNQESQFKRKADLHQVKMVADAVVDDARYARDLARVQLRNSREGLQQAEAILKQSNERLAKTNIRAPITGIVTSLDIKVGETAIASQVGIAGSGLMTIANTATMMTEVNVDETDIARIKVGQEVAIHTAAFPDVALKGAVETIPLSPKKNEGLQAQGGASLARNYNIKVRMIDTKGLTLRPGMTSRAEIYTATSGKSLALPLQAVLSNNDEKAEVAAKKDDKKARQEVKIENYVFVNQAGTAEKKIVKVGIADDSLQEILGGLNAGDVVITGPYKILRHLKAGDRVKTASANAAGSAEKAKS